MFALGKTNQLNIFEQISELKSFALNQPVEFISLLAENFDNLGLLQELKFNKVFIAINSSNQKNNKISDFKFNNAVIPLCPITKEPFKGECSCGGKNRSQQFKFTCLKS